MRILIFLLLPFFSFGQYGLKRGFISGSYTAPPPPVSPRDYYISQSGTGDGLTSGTPAPISILTSATFIAGDNIFLNRGDIFYFGNLNISNKANIDIAPFGSGADSKILGSTYIGDQAFVNNGDGTWYLSMADAPLWLMEGDVALRLAESAWIPITVNVSAQVRRVNGATIDAMSSIIGAKMRTKEYPFRLSEECTVTGWDTSTDNITFTGTLVGGAAGMPIKLSAQKQFMTVDGDWFYDEAAERLYIKSVSTPTGRDLRIITHDYGIFVNGTSNVTIDNIEFKHFLKYPLLIANSPNVSVTNCSLNSNRGNAIRAYGNNTTNLVLTDLTIFNNGLRGIEFGAIQGGDFSNLTIYDIGVQLNLGFPWDEHKTGGTGITIMGELTGGSMRVPNNVIIDHVNISNVGYQCVQLWGTGHQVKNSVLHDFCQKWSDGGGVHLYYFNGLSASTSNCLTQHNIIYNGLGNNEGITAGASTTVAAVYHDSGINNNTIDSNVIYNPGTYGIFCNDHNTGHTITNNIISATTYGVQIWQNNDASVSFPYTNVTNVTFTGNIISVNAAADKCLRLSNGDGNVTFNPFISINNNHYVNPYGTTPLTRTSNGSAYTDMTLAQWQTYIGAEGSATERTNYKVTPDGDDILIETNATDSPVNFNTPVGYSDYSGNAFSNPVSIPARYGLPYFQN